VPAARAARGSEDDDIGPHQPVDIAHLVAAQRDMHFVAFVAQDRGEHVRGFAIVVRHQHAQRRRSLRRWLQRALTKVTM